jgi:ATP/maltotriose-dependent transcriptional regulator MalT
MLESSGSAGSDIYTTGFVSRPRLLARITYGLAERLVIIEGSGGSGKSALAADWLTRIRPGAAVWMSLDSDTTTPRSFWFRFARAFVNSEVVGPRGPLDDFFRGYIDAEHVVDLAAMLLNQRNDEVFVVVDDAHLAPPTALVELGKLLVRVPTMRLIATTRTSVTRHLSGAAADVSPSVISGDELAFTESEFLAVAELTSRSLSYQSRREAFRAESGHPLRSRVALASAIAEVQTSPLARAAGRPVPAGERRSHGVVPSFESHSDYLLALRLSAFSWVDEDIVRAVGGESTALERFVKADMGHVDAMDGRFRFHSLVRASLGRAAPEGISAGERVSQYRRVAEIMTAAGDQLEAIRLLILAGDFSRIWPIIANSFSELITYRDTEVLARLEAAPAEAVGSDPGLAAALATFLSERESAPSERLRNLVEQAIIAADRQRTSDRVSEFFRLLAVFAAYRAARQYVEAGAAGDRLLSLVNELDLAERHRTAGAIAAGTIQIIITSIILGRFKKALSISVRLNHDIREGSPSPTAAVKSVITTPTPLQNPRLLIWSASQVTND